MRCLGTPWRASSLTVAHRAPDTPLPPLARLSAQGFDVGRSSQECSAFDWRRVFSLHPASTRRSSNVRSELQDLCPSGVVARARATQAEQLPASRRPQGKHRLSNDTVDRASSNLVVMNVNGKNNASVY